MLKHIKTENIADTNILTKAVTVYVGKKIGLKACGSKNKKELEPWGKRRIKKLINKVTKHKHFRTSPKKRDKEERKIRGT